MHKLAPWRFDGQFLPTPRRLTVGILLAALAWLGTPVFGQSTSGLPSPNALKRLSVDQLMDIDVTSVSKRPEKLFEAASAIQVITGDDVRRSGATSLPEALRFASNLEIAQVDSRQWAITARGFNNVFADKMLVMIDGRSVYTPLYAGVYWDVQDTLLEDLDRIEVISGPGSTQWGANAVNGVINITTKSSKDTQGGLLVGTAGSELRDSSGARYGGKIAPGIYYRVYGKYSERGESVRPNGTASRDSWRFSQGGVRVDTDAAAGHAFTFQGDVYNGSLGRAGLDNISVSGNNVLGRWTRTFDMNSDLKLQVYLDRTHRSTPGSFTQDLQTIDLDFQHRFPLGTAHDIVWGLGYRVVADDIANTPANAFLPAKVTREWANIFAQDEISLSKDRLILTLGTKIEHDNYVGFEWEPSARIAWTPNKRNTLWAAVSRSVRTPSRIDRDLFSPATPPYRIAGGRKVVSEKLLAYEVGYRLEITPSLVTSIATFFNVYDDLRSLEPLTPPLAFPVQANNGLRGRSSGAELTAEWQPTRAWRLRTGYTEMRVSSEPQPGNADRGTRNSIARDPNRQLQLRSLLNIYANGEFDSALRYVAPIGSQSLPGYIELDLRLGWQPTPHWEISLQGTNLLHKSHPEFNTPGSRREIQRGVQTKASWRF